MSANAFSPRPVVFVALDACDRSLVPAKLDGVGARGRVRLEPYDVIDGSTLATNKVLGAVLRKTRDSGGRLHLFTLLSDAGVRASVAHLFTIIDAAKSANVRVVVHAILDGVDSPSGSAPQHIEALEAKLDGGVGRIGTVCGRTWGMAPEGRWDRIEKVYRAVMADGVDRADSALRGVQKACMWGVPEQFVTPFVVFDYPGVSLVDSALHCHFSADGARELTQALAQPNFTRFERKAGRAPFAGRFTSMTPYDDSLGLPTLFPRAPDPSELPLDAIDAAGCSALRLSLGQAPEIASAAEDALRSGQYRFVFADLASPANLSRSRCEGMNTAVERITSAALQLDCAVVLLGCRDATDSAPLALLGRDAARIREGGSAGDLAATLFELLRLPCPRDVDGSSLLVW